MTEKKEGLKKLIENLHEGIDPEEAKKEFKKIIKDTGPDDLAKAEEELVKEGMPREKLNKLCDVHLAVFKEQLDDKKILVPIGHPINILMEEHRLILEITEKLNRTAVSIAQNKQKKIDAIKEQIIELVKIADLFKDSIKHYLREENVLFPYIEKHGLTEPPAQMWIDHDKIRDLEKDLYTTIDTINAKSLKYDDFTNKLLKAVGSLAGMLTTHFFKENNILFPASLRLIAQDEWKDIRKEFDEIGYCSFTPKEATKEFVTVKKEEKIPEEIMMEGMIEFETGPLPMSFIEPILNTLPIDITFVDHEDKVRFFSKGAERIFVRTKAVIGRSVVNCHPEKSYHVVNQILDDFRAGKRKTAEFWIDLGGRKIHIRYFAVHNKEGKYLGCLEASQDITEIQKLEGQKRLLD
ncbi:MAG: DUF438 domain-containing protein [Candidatus Heimdallarchaeota archaeon]|nr:DUF438 domain-containing protein [Candidatus Heimdallarchaeota archaeon]